MSLNLNVLSILIGICSCGTNVCFEFKIYSTSLFFWHRKIEGRQNTITIIPLLIFLFFKYIIFPECINEQKMVWNLRYHSVRATDFNILLIKNIKPSKITEGVLTRSYVCYPTTAQKTCLYLQWLICPWWDGGGSILAVI